MPGAPSDGTRSVLVTGATGVLGHRLVERLADDGHDVRGMVRDDEGADRVERRGGTAVRGDVLEAESLADLEPPDVLVHAATAVPTTDKPTDEEWAHNDRVRLDGARNLVDAMGSDVEHVCFPSVVWLARQPDGSTFREDAVRHPDRATRSAAATEDFLQGSAEAQDFDLSILRCGFFYAPDAAHTREWGERLLDRRLPIVGGGLLGRRDAELSFVHPDDAARAFAAVVDAGATGLYHVVDDEPVTPAAFFETFADLLEAPTPFASPAGSPGSSSARSPPRRSPRRCRRPTGSSGRRSTGSRGTPPTARGCGRSSRRGETRGRSRRPTTGTSGLGERWEAPRPDATRS